MRAIFSRVLIKILLFVIASSVHGQDTMSTNHSGPECIVLQVCPEEPADGGIVINGKNYHRTPAWVFLPGSSPGTTISCPLIYFQDSCSLTGGWIFNGNHQRIQFRAEKLKKVVITKKRSGVETVIELPDSVSIRIFDYFRLEINHNPAKFKGLDCYAFQSLLANTNYFPADPPWQYRDTLPLPGNHVVLTKGEGLPGIIRHWALYLGEDVYLSKFGKEERGTQAPVEIMNLEGMKYLYNCNRVYTAYPRPDSKPWAGYQPVQTGAGW